MTTTQGKVDEIKSKITSITEKIICQSLGKLIDSKDFTQNISNLVTTQFVDDITKQSSETYFQYMDPNKYSKKIENTILDVAENSAPIER